jgi:hypothetical protein
MVTTQQKTRTIVIPANADPHQAALLPEKHPPPVYNRFVQRFLKAGGPPLALLEHDPKSLNHKEIHKR